MPLPEVKRKEMIEPRRAQRAQRYFFMIQSKKTDWIIRTLWGNTPGEKRDCPQGLGFWLGRSPAQPKALILRDLGVFAVKKSWPFSRTVMLVLLRTD